MTNQREPVDPARVDWGRTEGSEGDIHASYSADRIGERKRIRQPFTWNGSRWCCVGMSDNECDAYRLTPPALFTGIRATYAERCGLRGPDDKYEGDAARNDPNGFYHGVVVQHKGQTFILEGPEVVFYADAAQAEAQEPQQLDLFAA